MKKLILTLALVIMSVVIFGQNTFKYNVIIERTTPTLFLKGTGGIINFNSGSAIINNTDADTLEIIETAVKITGDLFITGTITSEHAGGMSYISTAGTQTIATGATFEKLFEGDMAYSSGHLFDFTESNGRLTYTGTPTIHVTITATLSITSDEAAQVCEFRIAKGGTTIAATNMPITFTATTTAMNVTLKWLDEVATGEYYELFGTSDTNDDTFILNNAVFAITKH